MNKNENHSGNLIMMMSGMTEITEIINMLKESIERYEISNSEKDLNKIKAACAFLMTKDIVDQNGGGYEGAVKAINEFDSMRAKLNIFNPEKN